MATPKPYGLNIQITGKTFNDCVAELHRVHAIIYERRLNATMKPTDATDYSPDAPGEYAIQVVTPPPAKKPEPAAESAK